MDLRSTFGVGVVIVFGVGDGGVELLVLMVLMVVLGGVRCGVVMGVLGNNGCSCHHLSHSLLLSVRIILLETWHFLRCMLLFAGTVIVLWRRQIAILV